MPASLSPITMDKSRLTLIMCIALIVIIIIMAFGWLYGKATLKSRNCNNIAKIYDNFPTIQSLTTQSELSDFLLRDFYIKTAYNCCATGQFKNDYVDICALKNAIKQGARCLDFGIYTIDDQPAIAVSSVNDISVKETYNVVTFAEAMDTIVKYAFSGSTCPNPNDPLLLHFRMKTNRQNSYDAMANIIKNSLEAGNLLLGKEYSYEYDGKNLGTIPIKDLLKKIIIILDKSESNVVLEQTALEEFVNIRSNSMFMRTLRNQDVQYTHDMQELIEYNKKYMTLCMPDLSATDNNISASLAMQYGCQLVAMNFQNFDSNMEFYDLLFDSAGYAFILKPPELRYIPVTIPAPEAPPEDWSYETRNIRTDYYSFNV